METAIWPGDATMSQEDRAPVALDLTNPNLFLGDGPLASLMSDVIILVPVLMLLHH